MKRMGGGFGGKETRSVFISCTAALAAHLTQRAVRVTLDRDVDMLITGQRHAFVAKCVGKKGGGSAVVVSWTVFGSTGVPTAHARMRMGNKNRYKAAATPDGKLLALDAQLFNNGGFR